jgi:hypothetical protein
MSIQPDDVTLGNEQPDKDEATAVEEFGAEEVGD